MANDNLIKSWLSGEQEHEGDKSYITQLCRYLSRYKDNHENYTFFCISTFTENYYDEDGFVKTISRDVICDSWYYSFISSGDKCRAELVTDELKSIFICVRVEAEDGSLLGVIGVGIPASSIEMEVRSVEQDFGLSVLIMNNGETVDTNIETGFFIKQEDLAKRTGITESIELNKSSEGLIQWFLTSSGEWNCLLTKYVDTLGWFLVLESSTKPITRSFQGMLTSNIIFIFIMLVLCIMVTTTVFIIYNNRMKIVENTDDLTGLINRKLFTMQYNKLIRSHRNCEKMLFMFDIDHFKEINDKYDHLFGNEIISMVGSKIQKTVKGKGVSSRWGGDEFIGILFSSLEEAELILSRFMKELNNLEKEECYRVTVSTGIVKINDKLSIDQMIKKADEALYHAKNSGRNRITAMDQTPIC